MVSFAIGINEDALLDLIDSKMDEIVEDIFAKSQELIVEKSIVDEGTLLKSGNINKAYLNKAIIYTAPYADVIEFGRLPGTMPPSDPIKAWVRRKGIARTDKDVNRIAWAIIKHIKRNGQEPRPFLSPAVEIKRNELKSK